MSRKFHTHGVVIVHIGMGDVGGTAKAGLKGCTIHHNSGWEKTVYVDVHGLQKPRFVHMGQEKTFDCTIQITIVSSLPNACSVP
jgi:hypothetical protein